LSKQYADSQRIIKDFDLFVSAYNRVYVPLQTIRQALTENNLTVEADSIRIILNMLSHQFHKSKYPEHYNNDKQDETGYKRDYETKLNSKWFKGDVFSGSFSSERLEKARIKYEKDIKKPTACRTKLVKGVTYSQFYFKPIEQGEFSD